MNQDEAISLAIDCILRDGCSDITTEKLELNLIKQFRNDFEKEIKAILKRGNIYEMEFKPIQYILTPKNRYVFDYRKAAIISPSCVVKFMALVFQIAEQIESARISCEKNTVFSYRFKHTDEGVFDKDVGYSLWKQETRDRSSNEDCNYIVSCDIAAFYDRVNIHRIESTLLSIGVSEKLTTKINELLLFWSKKDSYGIPVGNVASRILAEAALIDIDNYLVSEGINFTRYVDDYRLFAPNLLTAQAWMNKLTTRLFRDGLMLNTGKTKIRKVDHQETENTAITTDTAAETVLKVITKLTGGYNRISKKFIMPAEDKHHKFIAVDLDTEMEVLSSQSIVEFEGIQKLVIASLVQKKFDSLIKIARICSSYLYSLDYFIDMLIKNADFIPEDYRNSIADIYAELIRSGDLYSFEWHCASVAKLLSHDKYYRKDALLLLYKSPAKDVTTYAATIALDGLKGKLTRSEFITIREFFDRSDEWEKRRLIHLSCSLPKEEKKAWGKAIKSTLTSDFLAKKYCELIINNKTVEWAI